MQKLDWIRLEYVADNELCRAAPSAAEKALHCLFESRGTFPELFAAGEALPVFHCRVYINDKLCWNDSCDFDELAQMLQQSEGTAMPFTTECKCVECIDSIDQICFTNDGTLLRWQTDFPYSHPMGCGESIDCADCKNWDWVVCRALEKRAVKNYCFSVGQFKREVLSLAYSMRWVNSLQTLALGGALSWEERDLIIAERFQDDDGFNKEMYEHYRWQMESLKKFLQTFFWTWEDDPFSFVAHVRKAQKSELETQENTSGTQQTALKDLLPPQDIFCQAGDPFPEDIAGVNAEIFNALYQAMNCGKLIEIYYCSNDGDESCRKILPEILVCREKKWYCAAFCTARQARRTFRLDRIRSVAVTDQTAESHGIADDVKANGLFGDMDFS